MKPLYSETEYILAKGNEKLSLECYGCKSKFKTTKTLIKQELKEKRGRCRYCKPECHHVDKTTRQIVKCSNCENNFHKRVSQIKKAINHFCGKSCAATYNNKNKTKGNRRSKLEIYLETTLSNIYPELLIDFNKKDVIGSELDIYIPSLKLAFELNGIFHYEPIYGTHKLNQIQNNDTNKFQKCIELGISLCIIDTSGQKYFKENTSQKYLTIIKNIINEKSLS